MAIRRIHKDLHDLNKDLCCPSDEPPIVRQVDS